jgi:hypothetical protein
MNFALCENQSTRQRPNEQYSPRAYSLHWSELKNRGSKRRQNAEYTWALYTKSLRDIFKTRMDEWLADTQWQSSIGSITRHHQFGELVRMGPPIIPLVLERIASGDVRVHWFPLLKDLAQGADPVPPYHRGHIQQMAREWLAWGQRNHFFPYR